jgi:ABC-type nitrate/sulfonate/bicarbonate transport system substrate-binding protein
MRHRTRQGFGLVLAAALAGTVAACGSSGGSASGSQDSGSASMTNFTLAIVPSQEFAPLYAGIAAGIFRQHGINLKLKVYEDPSPMVAGVQNNSFQGMGLTGRCSRANLQGIDLVSVADFTIRPAYELLATKDITSVAGLAGQTVVVGEPTTGPALRLNASLKQAGVQGKVKILNVASATTEVAAYRSGQAQGIYLAPTTLAGLIAAKPGSHIIVSVPETGPPTPGMGLCVSQSYLTKNPALVRQMVEAMSQSYTYALNPKNEAEIVKVLMTDEQLPLTQSEAQSVYPTLKQTDSPYPISTTAQLQAQVQLDVAGGAKETLAQLTKTFNFTIAQEVVKALKISVPAELAG